MVLECGGGRAIAWLVQFDDERAAARFAAGAASLAEGLAAERGLVEPARIDFEGLFVGLTAQRALTVRNIGSADLVVQDIRSSHAAYTVEGKMAFAIDPGASRVLSARFRPRSAGEHRGTLTIHSNSAERPDWAIPLLGAGIEGPKLLIDPASLDFGSVVLGESAQLQLEFKNVGAHLLEVSGLKVNNLA